MTILDLMCILYQYMWSFVFLEVARRWAIAPLVPSLYQSLAMHALYIMGVILVLE